MKWRTLAMLSAGLLVIALPLAIRHLREEPPPPDPPVRLTFTPPTGAEFGTADEPFDLAIAPDGRQVVFAASSGGHVQLWRRALDADAAEPLKSTDSATLPRWSGDGGAVYFFAQSALQRTRIADGHVERLADAPAPAGAAIAPDGTVLFAPTGSGPLKRLAGGTLTDATQLRNRERAHTFPAYLPDGRSFVYVATRDDGRRTLRRHDETGDEELARTDSHGIVVGQQLVHVRDGTLLAVRFDDDMQRLAGTAVQLAHGVGIATSGRGAFDAAGRILIWAATAEQRRELRWFDLDGRAIGQIGEPADYWQVRLSPDERTVAVTLVDPLLRTLDVATLPVTGGAVTRVSLAVAADSDPVWSPDGRRMAFRSWQDGQPHLYTRRLDATTGPDEPLSLSPFDEIPTDWKQDQLVFHARGKEGGFDLWGLRTAGGTPTSLARSGFNEVDGRVSPDGRWLAYSSDESGQWDVYLDRLPPGKQRTRVSTAGGSKAQWAEDGRALLFLRGRELMRAGLKFENDMPVVTTPTRLLVLPPQTRDHAVSRDGQRVLAIVPAPSASALVMHAIVDWANFPAPVGPGK